MKVILGIDKLYKSKKSEVIEVKDDLGNLYESQSFGMSGNNLGWWSNKVFEKVNKYITFTTYL
ncbi:hypothetical protein [Clostridium sp. 1001271B_151109_B4]|uniref:hypothetical protein n=1 Tax=Clostridium sp. 1001271B_151109_B4 TaxID=2787148 RepID=UPI0018AA0C04|nr:hypothetical protein [Clostridium sp. 1001271B_151109_B4]